MTKPIPAAPTTKAERSLAMAAHMLQLFTGFLGPLLIYFGGRKSHFVAFHSLQAFLWQLALVLGFVLIVLLILLGDDLGIFQRGSDLTVGLVWFLAMAVIYIIPMTLVLAGVFAIKAWRGEWAEYPLIGPLARHMAGIPRVASAVASPAELKH